MDLPLPSHTSDVSQPLDLIIFSPTEGKDKDKLYQFFELNGDPTRKKDFCHLYYEARQATFEPSYIESAFARLVSFHSALKVSLTCRRSLNQLLDQHDPAQMTLHFLYMMSNTSRPASKQFEPIGHLRSKTNSI
jgi:hypothetical protein